jgi:hypothetical protein
MPSINVTAQMALKNATNPSGKGINRPASPIKGPSPFGRPNVELNVKDLDK